MYYIIRVVFYSILYYNYLMKKLKTSNLEIKKSKFISILYEIDDISEVNKIIEELKIEHKKARHIVYAYNINGQEKNYSDKEPSGTTRGLLDLIHLKNKTNTLIVVIRYFGGILLGAPGLVSAYTDCAVNGIESAKLAKKAYMLYMEVTATYQDNANIEALARKKGYIKVDTVYEDVVKSTYIIEKERKDAFVMDITEITKGKAQTELIKEGYTVIPSKEIQ